MALDKLTANMPKGLQPGVFLLAVTGVWNSCVDRLDQTNRFCQGNKISPGGVSLNDTLTDPAYISGNVPGRSILNASSSKTGRGHRLSDLIPR